MKNAPVAFILFTAGCLLAGCGRGSAPAGAGAGKPPHRAMVVGFAQEGVENLWRAANTESMKSEAARRGIELKFADGQSRQENQIRAVRSFVAQGVDAIVISPIVATGWDPALREAKAAHIPVVLIDRGIYTDDLSLYACYIGSDAKEGERAAEWLAKHTSGKASIVELQGTAGAAPTNDRHNAFLRGLAAHPHMTVIASQSGDYRRVAGKEVMEAFLKRFGPHGIDAVYSHNDEMALGAALAIEEAGLRPGRDILLVSIDGIKQALQAIADGTLNCSIEYTPLYGPKTFETVEKIVRGQKVPKEIHLEAQLFDRTNVAGVIAARPY